MNLVELERFADIKFFDYQVMAMNWASQQLAPRPRACLYYKTGAGKSITALAMMALWRQLFVVVIAPPVTHPAWKEAGKKFGIEVEAISHAKFRQPGYKLSKNTPVIADEFHLFGGHSGKGWQKLDRLAKGLDAPLILASATPNYNDAERVYCIQHVLDPNSCRGGFLEFLYKHCKTSQNPFGVMPNVEGFVDYGTAAEYLADLPNVMFLPDDLVYTINDIVVPVDYPAELETYGYNRRVHRVIGSQMEERHAKVNLALIDEQGFLDQGVYDLLTELVGQASTPVLIYANHSTVADALDRSLAENGVKSATLTGSTPAKKKDARMAAFIDGALDVLVGTATLATGADGMDKMCDMLIILDDTDDDSLRRQLIGRIMPRGADADATKKQVIRIVLS